MENKAPANSEPLAIYWVIYLRPGKRPLSQGGSLIAFSDMVLATKYVMKIPATIASLPWQQLQAECKKDHTFTHAIIDTGTEQQRTITL